MRKTIVYISVLVFAMVLAACGSSDKEEATKDDGEEIELQQPEIEEVEITDDEIVPDEDVVLEVEGQEITGDKYNRSYQQTKVFFNNMGEDTDDLDYVQEKTLETIVYQTILMQDAADKGIEVSDDEFDKEFKEIKDENDEALDVYMDQFQMTEDSYKEQLRYSMIYEKYINEEFPDIEISDEEIEEVYEEIKEGREDVPDLKEVREELKYDLVDQRTQQLVTERMDKLVEKASIKEHI